MLSVVMPVYNQEPFIAEAIESVLAQTFRDFELLVCDDGSRDRSVEIAGACANSDSRVRIVSHPNMGAAETMNDGIRRSTGEWIACMHGDDVMRPNRLERQVAFLRENPDIVLTSCMVQWIDESGRPIGFNRCNLTDRSTVLREIAANRVLAFPHPGAMFRRSVFDAAGGYRQFSFPTDDLDLWNRISDLGFGVLVQPEVLLNYRVHANSTSTLKAREVSRHIRWVEACVRARRSGGTEPTVEQFIESRRAGSLLARWNDLRVDEGHAFYQVALAHRSGRRFLRASMALAGALMLRPETFMPRLLARLSPAKQASDTRNPARTCGSTGLTQPGSDQKATAPRETLDDAA